MDTVIILIHLLVVVALVIVVLLQRSEGGALGIGGGGGGLVSARGAADAMTRTTGILAAVFFATSILLGVLAQNSSRADAVLGNVPGQLQTTDVDAPTVGQPPVGDGNGVFDSIGGGTLTDAPAPPAPSQVPLSD